MSSFGENHPSQLTGNQNHNHTKPVIPETKVGSEGSAKRNIIRRKNPGTGASKANKAANNVVDDGSTYVDPAALDDHDPNYDSEVK